jgi:tetratricopeptide (TPR) repeat protein
VPHARQELSLPEAIARAAHAYAQGRFDEVEAISTAILKAVPDHFDALHLLGVLRGRQGRLAEALNLLDKATSRNNTSAQVWSNRGHVLYLQGRYPDAIASCERALAIAPDTADALNNRGNRPAFARTPRRCPLTTTARSRPIPACAGAQQSRLTLHRLERPTVPASYDQALTIILNAGALTPRRDVALAAPPRDAPRCDRAVRSTPSSRSLSTAG